MIELLILFASEYLLYLIIGAVVSFLLVFIMYKIFTKLLKHKNHIITLIENINDYLSYHSTNNYNSNWKYK